MKRSLVIIISCLILLSLSFVSASWFSDFFKTGKVVEDISVSNVLNDIIASVDSPADVAIVYGDNADFWDVISAGSLSFLFPVVEGEGYIKKASEIANLQAQHLILIGGPCANQISEQITDERGYNCDDWKFDVGESLVKVFDNGQKKIILISGTTREDTQKMSEAMVRYENSNKLSSSNEVVFGTPLASECGNEICEIKETDANCPVDCLNEGSVQLTSGLIVKTLDISNGYVTFHDDNGDVYLQNLETKELEKIGQGSWPQMDGDYIVYMSDDEVLNEYTGNYVKWSVIRLYQISTEKTISLTEAKIRYYHEWPIISGNNIIWLERNEVYEDTNPPKLMIYAIETKSTKKLVDMMHSRDSNFKIYGNKIVYQGPKYCVPEDCSQVKTETSEGTVYENAEEGDQDIWLYDMNTNKKIRITSNEEYQGMPDIYNDLVVWVDDSNLAEGKIEIHTYDLITEEEEILGLPNVVLGHSAVSISGDKIVFTDSRNGNGDVYLYDILRNAERRLTLNADSQGGAKISGNNIVWIDHRNGRENQDIYMLELT